MKLVHNWKDCWKWFSTHAMVAAAAIQTTWALIPSDLKMSLPPDMVSRVTICLLIFGFLGRLTKQTKNYEGK